MKVIKIFISLIIILIACSKNEGKQVSELEACRHKSGSFNWKKWEISMKDSEKLKYLKKLLGSPYFETPLFKNKEHYDFNKYHLIDFNADKLIDAVYEGRNPSGIETDNIVFFLNDGDSLRLIIKLNGNFKKIERKDPTASINFQLIKTPCCDYHIYFEESYVFGAEAKCFVPNNSTDGHYQYLYGQVNDPKHCVYLYEDYAYSRYTQFPSKMNLKDTIRLNKKVILGPKPIEGSVNDPENDPVLLFAKDETWEDIECIILAEARDKKGKTFCFIRIKFPSKKSNKVEDIDHFFYGWVDKIQLK